MAVDVSLLTGGGSGSDTSIYTTGSMTPTANLLVLAAIYNVEVTGSGATCTATGNGLTYVQIATVEQLVGSIGTNAFLFRAMGSSPTAGGITFDYSGNNQRRAAWSVVEFSDIDTGGDDGADAIVQNATNKAETGESLTVTLSAFGDATNNATFGFFGKGSNGVFTEGSGFTELHDEQAGGEGARAQSEWRLGEDTSVDVSWTGSTSHVGIAVEIKAVAVAATRRIFIT